MPRHLILLLTIILPSASVNSLRVAVDERILGRWDISITTPAGTKPSWLEIEHSGRDAIVGRFVGVVGSARPIARIVANADSLSFSIPHQWEDGNGDLTVSGKVQGSG